MIDSTLQQELRAKYNPDGSKLREAQMAILEILKYVDGLCRKHNLCYWLSSGTLLGAIRHGGFIPWDDDIDIEMPLKDYRKLRKIMIRDKESQYAWQDHFTDPAYWQFFAKVRDINTVINEPYVGKLKYNGYYIDIFPIEAMPKYMSYFSFQILAGRTSFCISSRNKFLNFIAHSRYVVGARIITPILRLISKLSKHQEFHHTYGVFFLKRRNLSTLDKITTWQFENTEFFIPQEYDDYLRDMYGDNYNELPPINMRLTHGYM